MLNAVTLQIFLGVIHLVATLSYIKIAKSYWICRSSFTFMLVTSLLFCSFQVVFHSIRLMFGIEMIFSLNLSFYFISICFTFIGEILAVILLVGFRNLGAFTFFRFEFKQDKYTTLIITGLVIIGISVSMVGYKQIEVFTEFLIIQPSFIVRLVCYSALGVVIGFVILNRKKISQRSLPIPLRPPLRMVLYGLIMVYVSSLFILIVSLPITIYLCCGILLAGHTLLCITWLKYPDFFNQFSVNFDLRSVMVIHKNGVCIGERTFQNNKGNIPYIKELQMNSARIKAIVSLVKDVLGTKEGVRRIELEGIEILFFEGKFTIGVLIVRNSNRYLRRCLKKCVEFFEACFASSLRRFDGDMTKYKRINIIFRDIFGI